MSKKRDKDFLDLPADSVVSQTPLQAAQAPGPASTTPGSCGQSRDAVDDVQYLLDESTEAFGAGSSMTLSDPHLSLGVKLWTTSGSTSLDLAIGGPGVQGGFPAGRITEIRGETSEGKSLILYHSLAANQRRGGISILFDTEEATVPDHAVGLGVDPSTLVMPQPKDIKDSIPMWTVEELVERIEFYMRRLHAKRVTRPVLIGWDSVAQTPSKYEADQSPGDENYGRAKIGDHAKALSQAFRRLPGMLSRLSAPATLICINQVRGGPSARPGLPEKKFSLGGRAIGFAASVRVEVRSIGDLYDKENKDEKSRQVIGLTCQAEVFKNKVSRPWRQARYQVYFESGICDWALWPEQLAELGVVSKKGGWYEFPDGQKMQWRDYMEACKNAAFKEQLRQLLVTSYKEVQAPWTVPA